jgi:hypothetical protein
VRPEDHFVGDIIKDGMDPDIVGERVVRAMRNQEFFIFTHTEPRARIAERHQRIMEALDEVERWEAERAAPQRQAGRRSART